MTRHHWVGIVGGLIAGVVLGFINSGINAMTVLSGLVRSDSTAVGWLVHLVLTTALGWLFAVWFGNRIATYWGSVGYGVIYGIVWWFLAWGILFPLILGRQTAYTSLFSGENMVIMIGYVVYGAILGLAFAAMDRSHLPTHAAMHRG